MNFVKVSKAYWKKLQLDVLAMIKQLSCPSFFKHCLVLTGTGKETLKYYQKETAFKFLEMN